ncbi:hypothetical protein CFAM422_010913 [Trichoderma lentiforme]|uniref:Uncharacterized protein n=1 Tax=Trichoderma lentiforme TaxID=1567552 RepID=A0A9P4X709_9HYPO|nr:hypothetical protein CFAM422_010913 [Trichoderma lentiforme]
MENSETSQDLARSEGKVRFLLQSVTHLVPSRDRDEKLSFIKNVICQLHWRRDFDWNRERMYPYGDDIGLKNRNCFYLIDHHGHDHTAQEEKYQSYGISGRESPSQADKAPSVHMNENLPFGI